MYDAKLRVQIRDICIRFRHEDAIPDFEAVLKLDKEMATAHVNLGLIYMLKMENYHRYWHLVFWQGFDYLLKLYVIFTMLFLHNVLCQITGP